jgi:hypothetical protein
MSVVIMCDFCLTFANRFGLFLNKFEIKIFPYFIYGLGPKTLKHQPILAYTPLLMHDPSGPSLRGGQTT